MEKNRALHAAQLKTQVTLLVQNCHDKDGIALPCIASFRLNEGGSFTFYLVEYPISSLIDAASALINVYCTWHFWHSALVITQNSVHISRCIQNPRSNEWGFQITLPFSWAEALFRHHIAGNVRLFVVNLILQTVLFRATAGALQSELVENIAQRSAPVRHQDYFEQIDFQS